MNKFFNFRKRFVWRIETVHCHGLPFYSANLCCTRWSFWRVVFESVHDLSAVYHEDPVLYPLDVNKIYMYKEPCGNPRYPYQAFYLTHRFGHFYIITFCNLRMIGIQPVILNRGFSDWMAPEWVDPINGIYCVNTIYQLQLCFFLICIIRLCVLSLYDPRIFISKESKNF